MLFVLVAGAATRGSRRWIDVGFFTLPAVRVREGAVRARPGRVPRRPRAKRITRARHRCSRDRASRLAPISLVFIQPDIGTALVYTAALAAVLFVAGVRWLHLGDRSGWSRCWRRSPCSGALPAAGVNVLKPYQAKRLTGFTHPDVDPRGATYNLRQSITAVGAGGLRGRGVAGATQTRLDYLPEHATDFAFASLAGAARLLRRVDPAAALPARRLARPEDRRRARATCSARSSPAGSHSCSSSRCSSTSA